jgi:osmotically inducible lipoprotein OsmB
MSILGVEGHMKSRLIRAWSRAKNAAIFAAVGAGIGGLFGKSAASSGAALGALVGATIGEKRASIGPISEKVTDEATGIVSADE